MIWKWVKLLPTFRAILMRSGSKSRVLGRVIRVTIIIFLSGNLPSSYPFGVFRICYNESFECWVLCSIISNFITNLDLLAGAVVLIISSGSVHTFFSRNFFQIISSLLDIQRRWYVLLLLTYIHTYFVSPFSHRSHFLICVRTSYNKPP